MSVQFDAMRAYYTKDAAALERVTGEFQARVDTLHTALAHGDAAHRTWLREAIDAHLAGQPVPPLRHNLEGTP